MMKITCQLPELVQSHTRLIPTKTQGACRDRLSTARPTSQRVPGPPNRQGRFVRKAVVAALRQEIPVSF